MDGPWLGFEPTHRCFSCTFVNVVPFRNGRMQSESLYFDLAALCRGIGLPVDEVVDRAAAVPRLAHRSTRIVQRHPGAARRVVGRQVVGEPLNHEGVQRLLVGFGTSCERGVDLVGHIPQVPAHRPATIVREARADVSLQSGSPPYLCHASTQATSSQAEGVGVASCRR